jgi:hypothetical protein
MTRRAWLATFLVLLACGREPASPPDAPAPAPSGATSPGSTSGRPDARKDQTAEPQIVLDESSRIRARIYHPREPRERRDEAAPLDYGFSDDDGNLVVAFRPAVGVRINTAFCGDDRHLVEFAISVKRSRRHGRQLEELNFSFVDPALPAGKGWMEAKPHEKMAVVDCGGRTRTLRQLSPGESATLARTVVDGETVIHRLPDTPKLFLIARGGSRFFVLERDGVPSRDDPAEGYRLLRGPAGHLELDPIAESVITKGDTNRAITRLGGVLVWSWYAYEKTTWQEGNDAPAQELEVLEGNDELVRRLGLDPARYRAPAPLATPCTPWRG